MDFKKYMIIACLIIFTIPNYSRGINFLENTNNCFTVTKYKTDHFSGWNTSIICRGIAPDITFTDSNFFIQDTNPSNGDELKNLALSASKATDWLSVRGFALINCPTFTTTNNSSFFSSNHFQKELLCIYRKKEEVEIKTERG